jgi:hypothetical protein
MKKDWRYWLAYLVACGGHIRVTPLDPGARS